MNRRAPRLSICIPAYNMGEWLGAAVTSALQICRNDETEVVVVDNCSTDDTREVLSAFGVQPSLRIVHATEHLDMIGNFNRTARLGRGQWLTLLSADDVVAPTYLENLEPYLDRMDAAAVSQIAMARWDDRVVPFGPEEPQDFNDISFGATLGDAACISTTAFRSDLFTAVGGFAPAAGLLFDFDFFFRIARESGLPIRTLGVEGGSYFPMRGSSWQALKETGEATELLLRWIQLRRGELGPAGARLIERKLARRALGTATHKIVARNRQGARRELRVAVTSITRGRLRCEGWVAWLGSRLPRAAARAALAAQEHQRAQGNNLSGVALSAPSPTRAPDRPG